MKRFGLVLGILLAIPLQLFGPEPGPGDMSSAEPLFSGPDVRVVRRGRRRAGSHQPLHASDVVPTMKDCWARLGGLEHPPACTDCAYVPVFGWMLCVPSCVGYIECNKIPNGCHFPDATKCITGGVFRNQSGIAIYPGR